MDLDREGGEEDDEEDDDNDHDDLDEDKVKNLSGVFLVFFRIDLAI